MPPQADPLLGQTLAGRYQIIRKLGEGGMGAVYLATHNLLEKQVALKVLHAEFARKQDLVDRFMQEAKAASRIRHENVIDISDFGHTPEGYVFFAMELLKGHDLHEEVARARMAGQLLPWTRSKKIFLQICSALAAAHAQGIIHRDLKPENIYLVEFLGDPDFVKLLDFGIAKMTEVSENDRKLTRTGMLFGTPEYMSPEQARGEHVDNRVDVYAMGCILFQLVTGRVPFEADNFMGVLSLHLTEPPPSIPPEVFDRIGAPRELANVIDRALLKEKEQRWTTITDLANAVRQVCGDPIPTSATGVHSVERAPSVQAPQRTTDPAVRRPMTPATGAPLVDSQQNQQRQRTQWTGNLSVPTVDDPSTQPPAKSKLPLIVGGVLVVGAAIALVIVLATGGGGDGDKTKPPGGGTNFGGTVVDAGTVATAVPDAPPAVLPDPPKRAQIRIDSQPHGANIKDQAGNVIGKTPFTFSVPGSNTARQFTLVLDGYADHGFEILPNQDKVEVNEKLERGVGGVGSNKPPGPGSNKPPGPGSNKPPGPGSDGPGSAMVKPPGPGSQTPPGPGSDCEFPCVKQNKDIPWDAGTNP